MIGIDIEDIGRLERMCLRKPQLVKRLFSTYEWQYANKKSKPHQTLTGFWCAKEAVVKAFSTIELLSIKDIAIIHSENGAPKAIILSHQFKQKYAVHISISHSRQQATAVAIIV